MREGPARSYETTDTYGLRFIPTGENAGWTAVTKGDTPIAYFCDGAMATAWRDVMNLATRK